MNEAEVLCAGIVVADHVCTPIPAMPEPGGVAIADGMLLTIGGCAANAAVDLVKMGARAAVVGRVGGDVFGEVVARQLRQQGVDVSALAISPQAETSQTMIVNVAGQDRRFIHTYGANAEFRAADIPLARLRQARILYVGGYLLMASLRPDELAAVFQQARQLGVRTVLDVVVPAPGDYVGHFEQLLPHVDVFLPNQHEAQLITGEPDPVRQAERFHRLGTGTVVVTMGGEGCVLVSREQRIRAGVFPVEFVDGSGGGDAFDAGFIYGLLHGLGTEDCLRYASALGASCVRALGTTPGVFTRDQCEEFLKKHTLPLERLG
jgi:sugar/nucleoside kinase (ribokinase family)